jgi:DNA repair protein REV1
LPGIGRHLEKKLDQRGLSTVQNVWDLGDDALAVLESLLGAGTGKKVYNFCCGRDDRPVVASERKSIGAECSYGVRFNGDYGPDYMISCLASEVSKRMTAVGVRGGAKVTLKLKKRKPNAHFPFKFLGSGSCDSLSKSCDVPGLTPTCDASVLSKLCWTMYRQFEVPKEDIRGMGIVVSKLSIDGDRSSASADENGKQPCIRSWLNASDTTANERRVKAQMKSLSYPQKWRKA